VVTNGEFRVERVELRANSYRSENILGSADFYTMQFNPAHRFGDGCCHDVESG
jgi:hypothetical protein